ncbi:hypothetical protein F66182_3428 [Fusarium sp. NRRL 66182]|nr:hypothetical protein F66182_3428 [Fusarium sp. NRRL 66182]
MGFIQTAAVAGLIMGAAQASPYKAPSNGTVYTTEVVTHLTTYCPEPTTLTYGDKTYTITEATTLTVTDCSCTISRPVKPTATGYTPHKDDCAETCHDKYNKCRVAPGANMASCAAQFAECLGYSPWDDNGSLVTPTACVEKPKHTKPVKPVYTTEVVTKVTTYCPEPTTLTYGNKTIPVTSPGTVTVTDCHFTTTKPVGPKPPSPTMAKSCAEDCSDAYDKCRGGQGANMAFCAAKYAECVGHNPWESGSFVTPTACSPAATGYTTVPHPTGPAGHPTGPNPTGPAGHPTGPNPTGPAGHPTGPNPTGPGYNPPASTPTGSNPPVVTAGAAQVVPAGLLAVVGAFALL